MTYLVINVVIMCILHLTNNIYEMIGKVDFAKALNKKFDFLDYIKSKKVVDAVFDELTDNIYDSKKVQIPGFATLYIDIKKPKKYFNPLRQQYEKTKYQWGLFFKISPVFDVKIKAKPCYTEDDEE